MREGLQVVLGNRLLRSIAGCTGTSNLFSSAVQAVLVLYATRDLGLPPELLGLAFGAGSVGALVAPLWVLLSPVRGLREQLSRETAQFNEG